MDGEKNVLTPEMVQKSLRRQALESLMNSLIFMIAFVPIVVAFIQVTTLNIPLLTLLMGALVLFSTAFVFPYIANCVVALVMSLRNPVMVKASRIKPVNEKDEGGSGRYHHYIIYFHGYGKRCFGGGGYLVFRAGFEKWFVESGILNTTDEGDKFYLLVDKLNRIVLFFPCKYFKYTGEVIPSKHER